MRSCLALLLLVAGCIGTTPEEELESEQGDDPNPPTGPFHRPGQRCLACHGEDHDPGGQVFVLAGTVYRRAGDALGLAGAEVEVTDDGGEVLHITTNRAGNFMVSLGGGGEPGEGWLGVSRAPTFPVHVTVRDGGAEQTMRNVIHREGACAACHDRDGKSAASNGKVYLEDTP
jgi:cytochrome c553